MPSGAWPRTVIKVPDIPGIQAALINLWSSVSDAEKQLCSQGAVQEGRQPAGMEGAQDIFFCCQAERVSAVSCPQLCCVAMPMAGCFGCRPFAWMIFKSDGASLRRSWSCIYSERSLVVCGKELGPGAEATTSRTKPQNLPSCQGLPICLPWWKSVITTALALLSALVIIGGGKNLFCSI